VLIEKSLRPFGQPALVVDDWTAPHGSTVLQRKIMKNRIGSTQDAGLDSHPRAIEYMVAVSFYHDLHSRSGGPCA